MSSHAEKCPVCKGTGKQNIDGITVTCNGCKGEGWVTVEDKPKSETKLVTNSAQPEMADNK